MKKLLITPMLILLLAISFAFAGEQKCRTELMNAKSNRGMRSSSHYYSPMTGSDTDIESLSINRYFRFEKQIGLSPEQIESLREMRLNLQHDSLDKYADIRETRSELNALLRNPVPDFTAIRRKVEEINDLQLELKNAMIDTYEQGYKLLTEDQKTKFSDCLTGKPKPKPAVTK